MIKINKKNGVDNMQAVAVNVTKKTESVKMSKEKRDLLYAFLTTKNKEVYEKLAK